MTIDAIEKEELWKHYKGLDTVIMNGATPDHSVFEGFEKKYYDGEIYTEMKEVIRVVKHRKGYLKNEHR